MFGVSSRLSTILSSPSRVTLSHVFRKSYRVNGHQTENFGKNDGSFFLDSVDISVSSLASRDGRSSALHFSDPLTADLQAVLTLVRAR